MELLIALGARDSEAVMVADRRLSVQGSSGEGMGKSQKVFPYLVADSMFLKALKPSEKHYGQ